MMVHKKIIFFALATIAVTCNCLTFTMHMAAPHSPSVKSTSFWMFATQLWSLLFVKNEEEMTAKMDKAKNELLSEIKQLSIFDCEIIETIAKNTKNLIENKLSRKLRGNNGIIENLRDAQGIHPYSTKIVDQKIILAFNTEQQAQQAANFLRENEPHLEQKTEKKREGFATVFTIDLKYPDAVQKEMKKEVLLRSESAIQLTNIRIGQFVKSIKNKWDQLSYFYVSNNFEKFFNKFGPNIDELKSFVTKKIQPLIHPDRHTGSNNLTLFTELTKTFNEDQTRKNPLTDPESVHYVNQKIHDAKDFVQNERRQQQLLAMLHHKTDMICAKETLEIKHKLNESNNVDAKIFCDTFVKKIEIDGYLRKKKKGQ